MDTLYFYSGIIGLFAGIALALFGVPALPTAGLCGLLSAAGLCIGLLSKRPSRVVVALTITLLLVGVGLARVGVGQSGGQSAFRSAVGNSVAATGTVVTRPAETEYGQKFTAEITKLSNSANSQDFEQTSKAVVYAGSFPQLAYGDRVRLSGQLDKPEQFTTDDDRTFPYPQYLARRGVYYELYQPEVKKLSAGGGSWLLERLSALRENLLAELHEHIPDPQSALTGGVLLGAEEALGKQLQADFRETSVIHIVVLSGFNVMVVATAIGEGLLALGLPLGLSAVSAIIGIVLFALLVGLTPTVVRASIMAVFAMLARVTGRAYAAGRGLSLAAVGMVLVNPRILLFDPSFQLSAVATTGLIVGGDYISNHLQILPQRFGLREAATATISAQLAVLPLLLYYTGTLSIVSVPANLLVLPVVPVLMATGAVTALFGFVSAKLAFLPAVGSHFLSEYIFSVVSGLANVSFASVSVPAFPAGVVVLVYLVSVAFVWQYQQGPDPAKALPEP